MTEQSRRTLLCAGAGLFTLAAGCLDDTGLSTGNGDDDTGGNESGSGGNGTEPTATGDLESSDNVSFDHTEVPTEPEATFVASEDRADGWLDEHAFDDDAISEFVEETPFEQSVLIALEADAPNLCYGLTLEDVTLEEADDAGDARLSIEAAVTDDSGDDEMCGQQLTAVGQLVRATFDGEPATGASVTIADSDGETHDIDIDVESDSDDS
ncbi:hypothetical protein [Natronorubrum sp. FCH18a]|uniref:hypothetical protein n=1 Tax=Natronorubrum sp. FCH18a TaxID=3447018 RepID=UPI003F50F6C4